MVSNIKHIRSTRISLLLFLLFIEYVAGITMFMHSHIIDGDVVYHSHFYSGSAEAPAHNHSSQQAKVISALMLYVALAATAFVALLSPLRRVVEQSSERCCKAQQPSLLGLSLRAPPVVM